MNKRDFILRWRPSGHIDRVEAFERDVEQLVAFETMIAVEMAAKKTRKEMERRGGGNLPVGHGIP